MTQDEKPIVDYSPPTTIQQVEQYVIDHPKCRRVDIINALGVHSASVSGALERLCDLGKIKRVREKEGGRVKWEAGAEDGWLPKTDLNYGRPTQTTVTTWEPERRRDHLTAALFGRGPANRRQD
jgi:hypothetical protein